MIRHQVYFDTLGSMKEDSASWCPVFAGLSVLRFVDAHATSGAASPQDWAELHSVRAAVEAVEEGNPVRGLLTTVFEEAIKRGAIDESVCRILLAYGRTLDYEASWGLATDVFATVASLVRPEKNARFAVEAHVAVGGAARRNGDWETSARAYSQAAYIADTLGDRPGVLTVQIGIANTYMAKGNLPQAQAILDDVIVQAREPGLTNVQADALHARAALAHRQGASADGVKLACEALNLATIPASKDFILEDIAAMFTEIGLRDSARDAHLILAATAQSKWVRWLATINLMELASLDEMEEAFDTYASELRRAPMGTWLKSHFLLFLGEGLGRFGRYEAAEEALEEAVAYTGANQIHAVTFKAEASLAAVRSRTRKPTSAPVFGEVPQEVLAAAHAISELRKAILVPA